MQVVDGKGLICPQPLILTRKALKNCLPGESLTIECDNETAYKNILTFLGEQRLSPEGKITAGVYHIEVVNNQTQQGLETDNLPAGNVQASRDYVVVFRSERMGEGDLQLGSILIKGFINALPEQPVLPTHLVFYNSGVRMVIRESGVTDALQTLQEKGVSILVCGTCVDYYGIRDQLVCGVISNMFTITETLAKTGHVINP